MLAPAAFEIFGFALDSFSLPPRRFFPKALQTTNIDPCGRRPRVPRIFSADVLPRFPCDYALRRKPADSPGPGPHDLAPNIPPIH